MRISDWSSDVCSSDLLAELLKSDRRLHLRQPEVRSKGVVEPAERVAGCWRFNRPPVLAMILVRPCHLPWRFLPEEEHAAFAAGRDDLVGAIGECRRVAEGTQLPAATRRALRPRAIPYHPQVMRPPHPHGQL